MVVFFFFSLSILASIHSLRVFLLTLRLVGGVLTLLSFVNFVCLVSRYEQFQLEGKLLEVKPKKKKKKMVLVPQITVLFHILKFAATMKWTVKNIPKVWSVVLEFGRGRTWTLLMVVFRHLLPGETTRKLFLEPKKDWKTSGNVFCCMVWFYLLFE